MEPKQITILGIGNILFRDEGVGIRVVERLQECYDFSENVALVVGGVLGLHLLGVISEADHLIVVDAVKKRGDPGTLYRLTGDEIPMRFGPKNSLHQVDFVETLTACRALGRVPDTVILGVEPEDIDTAGLELTPAVEAKVEEIMDRVLAEIDRLGASYRERTS